METTYLIHNCVYSTTHGWSNKDSHSIIHNLCSVSSILHQLPCLPLPPFLMPITSSYNPSLSATSSISHSHSTSFFNLIPHPLYPLPVPYSLYSFVHLQPHLQPLAYLIRRHHNSNMSIEDYSFPLSFYPIFIPLVAAFTSVWNMAKNLKKLEALEGKEPRVKGRKA